MNVLKFDYLTLQVMEQLSPLYEAHGFDLDAANLCFFKRVGASTVWSEFTVTEQDECLEIENKLGVRHSEVEKLVSSVVTNDQTLTTDLYELRPSGHRYRVSAAKYVAMQSYVDIFLETGLPFLHGHMSIAKLHHLFNSPRAELHSRLIQWNIESALRAMAIGYLCGNQAYEEACELWRWHLGPNAIRPMRRFDHYLTRERRCA